MVTGRVVINKCTDCRHWDHSGAFTPGGAKPVCGHSDSIPSKRVAREKGIGNRHHWKHRVIEGDDIPDWCPLRKDGCLY